MMMTMCSFSPDEFDETIEGPYYTQLGAAKDMVELRDKMEERYIFFSGMR
jgi:hypothetical protein